MTQNTKAAGAKKPEETAIEKAGMTHSERFTQMVTRQFAGQVGTMELTGYQKRLIQNYFIKTDMSLRAAEEKRLRKEEKFRDKVPVTWENVHLEQLAIDVVACSRVGYDPALPNHISMIPYKNNRTGKYDIGFIEGYRGRELKARKYGFDVPNNVIVELVHENDHFRPIKKDSNHDVETYEFDVKSPFDRGAIAGGFYYHEYYEVPRKNRLAFFTLDEILKRKPEYASAEFWGGERTRYENGKKVNETVEGWFPEMCWKTLYRMAYGAISIDSEKIDDNLMAALENENRYQLYGNEGLEPKPITPAENVIKPEVPQALKPASKKIVSTDIAFVDVKSEPAPATIEEEQSEDTPY